MASLSKREVNGKKYWCIFWTDYTISERSKQRKQIRCDAHGALNRELRKKLLQKYQEKEFELKKQVEIFGTNKKLNRPYTPLKTLIDEYLTIRKALSDLREKNGGAQGISPKTYYENQHSLKILLEYCTKNRVKTCKEFDSEAAQGFRNWLEAQGRNPSTNIKIMRGVKQFLKYYEDYRPTYFENVNIIIRKLKSFKTEQKLPKVFRIEELRTLILTARELDCEQCNEKRQKQGSCKNYNNEKPLKYSPILPFILLLTFTGMRLSEALSLRWSDIDLEKGNIRINAKKTFRERILPLVTDPAGQVSNTFLDILRIWKLKAKDADFVLPKNGIMKPTFSKWTWRRFKNKAQVENNTPQSFRSTFVSFILSWGVPLPILSRWTGHSLAVVDKHYFDVVKERCFGDSLEEIFGLKDIMRQILTEYRGKGNLAKTRWA